MALITLSTDTFSLIPEGRYTFKCVSAEYKPEFGKLTVGLQTANGIKHTERFTLLDKKGEVNEGAVKAFTYFAQTLLNDFTLAAVDPDDLPGHFITADVEHYEYTSQKTGKPGKGANLSNYEPASGFGASPTEDDDEEDLDDYLDE